MFSLIQHSCYLLKNSIAYSLNSKSILLVHSQAKEVVVTQKLGRTCLSSGVHNYNSMIYASLLGTCDMQKKCNKMLDFGNYQPC